MATKINPKQISGGFDSITAITAADADLLMISDATDDSLKKITLSALSSYVNSNVSVDLGDSDAIKDGDANAILLGADDDFIISVLSSTDSSSGQGSENDGFLYNNHHGGAIHIGTESGTGASGYFKFTSAGGTGVATLTTSGTGGAINLGTTGIALNGNSMTNVSALIGSTTGASFSNIGSINSASTGGFSATSTGTITIASTASTSGGGKLSLTAGTSTAAGPVSITRGHIEFALAQDGILDMENTAHNITGRTLDIQAGGPDAGTTNNIGGGDLELRGGQGKGTADGGDILLKVSKPADTAGSSINALSTVVTISGNDGSSTFAGDVVVESSTTEKPVLNIKNTNADANGATLKFTKDGGSAADNDVIGNIQFIGDDEGGGVHTFGEIVSTIADATAGAEGGKMELKVASHDGTSTAGLTLTDGDASGEVDVTLGAGAASVVTIPGKLVVNGTTTTVTSTTVNIDDPIFTLAGGATGSAQATDDNKDRGIEFHYNDGGAARGFFGYDDSAGRFTVLTASTNTSEVFTGRGCGIQAGEYFIIDGTDDNSDTDVPRKMISTTGSMAVDSAVLASNSGLGVSVDANGGHLKLSIDSLAAGNAHSITDSGSAYQLAVLNNGSGNTQRFTIRDLAHALGRPTRDVFFSGAVGNTDLGGEGGIDDQGRANVTSGSMSHDLLTASLSSPAKWSDSIQVYLNGLLLAPSGSLVNDSGSFTNNPSDETGGGGGDYRMSTGLSSDDGGGFTPTLVSETTAETGGSVVTHILLNDALDSDDILTVHYVRQD